MLLFSRVFRQRTIQTQAFFSFFKTNDQSSSASSSIDFGSNASGESSVSLKLGNFAAFFLATHSPYYAPLQMFLSTLLSYFALHMISVFLLVSLLNTHMALDSLDFAFYILYKNTFAFHWGHDRFFSMYRFHNVSSVL